MTSCHKIIISLTFFQFMANLDYSGSQIPDAKSRKFIFSLIVTFFLTDTENKTKKELWHYRALALLL